MGEIELENDISLYYECLDGNINKPVLIFLHEGLGCTAMWKEFPRLLCHTTGCSGLIYDRLGYGKSSPLQKPRDINYLHEYALGELQSVISSLIPERSYIIIGHSDGGSIGLIWAGQDPPLMLGLITEAAHVFVDSKTLAGIRAAERAYQQGKFRILNRYHGDKTDSIFRAWSETWLSSWFKDWNIENLLPHVHCPVLGIQGCDDQYGEQFQLSSIISGVTGSTRAMMVKDCGHIPHAEQTDIILSAMAAFIGDIVTV